VPQDSVFAHHQSYGATDYDHESANAVGNVPQESIFPSWGVHDYFEAGSKPVVAVSWMSAIGALYVLGREWGPEDFFLACAMVLLVMFGGLIIGESRHEISWFQNAIK
jgi:hypothetical protein